MSESKTYIIGPFSQLLTFDNTSLRGALINSDLPILENAGILISDGKIIKIDGFEKLIKSSKSENPIVEEIEGDVVGMPGIIDAHTHICYGGSRHIDYAARNTGVSYLEIARNGGGIWDTVTKTRNASAEELYELTKIRAEKCGANGVTTLEVKSGYGLSLEHELRQLKIINKVNEEISIDLIPTCLAAHIKPKDFEGGNKEYLTYLTQELLPEVIKKRWSKRIDIFVEEDAFLVEEARKYLTEAKKMGFQFTVHGDQFSTGGSKLGVELGALSVDHLEVSGDQEINMMGKSNTVATVLPGASLGLGCNFAPARKLLNAGAIVAIASDWNPGSGPMGDLITQAAIMGASEKLSDAEIFAGITFRAAAALGLADRGRLQQNMISDIVAFPVQDYREILYHQGQIKPKFVWKKGKII